jgi:hypothetical protein
METSKHWLETARLGQRIVHELGLDHTNKLLNRWMAHRVAALMELAESAPTDEGRKTAQDECTELILRLWEKRMDWPDGGPLKLVLPALLKLMPEPSRSYDIMWDEADSGDSWSALLPQLRNLQMREMRICLFAAIADIPKEASESARTWLDEEKRLLSEEERVACELLADWGGSVYEEDFELDGKKIPFFGSLPHEERTKHTHAALKRISDRRAELLAKSNSRDGQLAPLEPTPMRGNISSCEELHGEYFDHLYSHIVTAFSGESNEEDDWESDEDNFGAEDDK